MVRTKNSRKSHYVPSQADMGLQGPPGKGSRPRNCFSNDFRENLDAALANSAPVEGFRKLKGGKLIKTYK